MSEIISFWLDNKMASAHKMADVGDQTLVDYRGKFYVIKNGSALMKGSRPLHYSKTSLPTLWKKALKGEIPAAVAASEEENLPVASVTKRIRKKKEKEEVPMQEAPTPPASQSTTAQTPDADQKKTKAAKKAEIKPGAQTAVVAQCPYCSQKHDIPLEKGKNGKPFFFTCSRCASDFAVRFVSVTMMQAQVAGFR